MKFNKYYEVRDLTGHCYASYLTNVKEARKIKREVNLKFPSYNVTIFKVLLYAEEVF